MAEERSRREEVPVAGPALDEKGEALRVLLQEALADFHPDIGAMLDEVTVAVAPDDVAGVCRRCKDDPRLAMDYLRCLSVVDYVDYLQVVYHLYSTTHRHKCVIKAHLSPDNPVAPSIIEVYRGADWHEREGHDLFGVVFQGHPNLQPLLLYEGFEGYPLRKSYPFYDYEEW